MKPITPEQFDVLVRDFFRRCGVDCPATEVAVYAGHFKKFDERWRTAKKVLGKDWRYAESLHAAGLLCRINWPRLEPNGKLLRFDTVYCVDPEVAS